MVNTFADRRADSRTRHVRVPIEAAVSFPLVGLLPTRAFVRMMDGTTTKLSSAETLAARPGLVDICRGGWSSRTVGGRRDHPTMTPTAGQLLDAFLVYRERTVTARTLARDRNVIEEFRESIDADGPCVLDEVTGRRLRREHGGVGLSDLLDVDGVVVAMVPFLHRLAGDEQRLAGLVLRQFVSWLDARRQLDRCAYMSLLTLTRECAPPARSTRRPRYRPPGGRRPW